MIQKMMGHTPTQQLLASALVSAALAACSGGSLDANESEPGTEIGSTSQALSVASVANLDAEIAHEATAPIVDKPADVVAFTPRDTAPRVGPLKCTFQTVDGHYLTAVGAGGRTTDVLHTDATRVGAWEEFLLIDSGDGDAFIHYGIQTANGHYLTAVGGGGRTTDVIHSDATQLQAWEKFTLWSLGYGVYAIQTIDGHYLTAVSGGGRITDTIHSDATVIDSWEKFTPTCTQP